MKTTSLVLALPAIVLTGCVTPKIVDEEIACRDRTITLNHARNTSISITNPTVEMCVGRTLTINIVPRVGANSARSAPKGTGASWLGRSSTDGGRIVITLVAGPGDEPIDSGDEFGYSVTVDETGTLDPTIRIIP